MLVHLRQYKHEEVQFADNRTTGESQTEDALDTDSEEYFGEDVDQMDVETWETVEYESDPIQRRDVTVSGVTAVSVPEGSTESDDADLPGTTIQIRTSGDIDHLERAEIVEVQDDDPRESAADGEP